MSYLLFLDDERFPPGTDESEWIVCRNVDDAKLAIQERGMPETMSLDHDLGEDRETGMDFCKWLVGFMLDENIDPKVLDFYVHSQNPIGAENMRSYLMNFIKTRG